MLVSGVNCEPKSESKLNSSLNQICGMCKEVEDKNKKQSLKKSVESCIKEDVVLRDSWCYDWVEKITTGNWCSERMFYVSFGGLHSEKIFLNY